MRRWFRIVRILVLVFMVLPVGVVFVLSYANGTVDVPTNYALSPMLLEPPAALSGPIELKVVTFNIQDLPLVSKDRPERMRAIGAKLQVLDPDIAGFQEAFVEKERQILLDELKNTRLQHHQYFSSGVVGGSGLLLASAFPIEEIYFHQYRASAPWYMIWEGDFWAGKGVALARLRLPDNTGFLDFFNTHAQAGYGNAAYDIVRTNQMREMADFINKARVGKLPALAVGDVNCRVGDADYTALVDGAGLVRLMNKDSRIDHIFGAQDSMYSYETLDTQEIAETVTVNQKTFELSDHKGWMSTIRITPNAEEAE
ncbi:MAG: endonuclease/exonuclease/phosphatase family protein [Candidatus Hydrogenedentes bacterium]|nr:endonuclease/exonuclease/phosphatase family protein [Candidatus Hydrogenedentota bacterium]